VTTSNDRPNVAPDQVVPGTSDLPSGGEPGAASVPTAGGSGSAGDSGAPRVGDRVSPGGPPPATNQGKVEPIPQSPHDGGEPGDSGTPGGVEGTDATDPQRASDGASGLSGPQSPVPAPGMVPGGTAPAVQASFGTSETMQPVQGVHTPEVGPGGEDIDTAAHVTPGRVATTSLAPPGSPDGEVDTRR